MGTPATLEERVAVLEAQMASLKLEQTQPPETMDKVPWWEQIRGWAKDDPLYDEAMRLGREWREAQREEHEDEAASAEADAR